MRLASPLLLAALIGCAATPEQMAQKSSWDVCRFTMGGPHARLAEAEAARRGLDCRPYYGAIQQQNANQNAAVQNYLNTINRPVQPLQKPQQCESRWVGNRLETFCW